MCENRFYICRHCGNLVGAIHFSGVPMICCGEEMEHLKANTVDASREKHVPVAIIEGDRITVDVGSIPHPMLAEHHIAWVYLQTEHGGHRVCLSEGSAPQVSFLLNGDRPLAVYAYCNLHGLWKVDLD